MARRSVGPVPPPGSCRTRLRLHRRSVSARGTFLLHLLLGVMRPALSPTRRPPRGETSAKVRRDAGAYSATAGPSRPQERAEPPREPCGLSGPHGPGGCLSAPAFGDFCPGPYFGFPLRPIAGALRSHLEPLKAGSGSPPLLALRRYRSAQASWISSPPLGSPSRRRSRPREGRIDPRPVAGQRRGNYRHGSEGGDKYPAKYDVLVNEPSWSPLPAVARGREALT